MNPAAVAGAGASIRLCRAGMRRGDVMELGNPAGRPDGTRLARVLLFAAWCLVVGWLMSRHVFWRDEVRAFTIALSGDTWMAMLGNLRGEGHPALWYLLLRAAHDLVPVREVLPAAAAMVAAAAAALLAFRSPFRPLVLGLILFSAFAVHEYAVLARNYGISMLLMFVIADRYPHWRDKGVRMGLLLALLCNTNVHSVILAAGFLIFWLAELTSEEGLRWTRKHWIFTVNALVAAAGVAACIATVYPSVHDALTPRPLATYSAAEWLNAVTPGSEFRTAVQIFKQPRAIAQLVSAIVLLAPLLVLWKRPGAIVSTAFVLVAFNLLFSLLYFSSYRHEGLYLVYLVSMAWLVLSGRGGQWSTQQRTTTRPALTSQLGSYAMILLLALQLAYSNWIVGQVAAGVPTSRAADLAELLKRESLGRALLIADPDFMLEAVPYYARNPMFLLREERFGTITRFTRNARLSMGLDQILNEGRRLRARSGRPVVIVLGYHLNPRAPSAELPHSYVQRSQITPAATARFLAATRKLASFPPVRGDETYDVYLLGDQTPAT